MEVSNPVVKQPKQHQANTSDILNLLLGPLIQRSICFVTTIGIPDLLAHQPQSAEELANKTNMHAASLYRALHALTGAGIFKLNDEQKFENTSMAEMLRSDVPNSMRDFVIFIGRDRVWNSWGAFPRTVASGITGQKLVYGEEIFDYMQKHPVEAAIFNRAMTANTLRAVPAILDAYDFSDINSLVDVGGGEGILLAKILKAFPHMHGSLFELPSVVEAAEQTFLKEGIRKRVDLVSGDFFKQSPPTADAYILKFVIHDWDDECSTVILKNIAVVMNKNSRILLLESIMPDGNEPSVAKLRDLQMMLSTGGKERTEKEYHELLKKAGLKLTNIYPTTSVFHIIEAALI